MKVIPALQHYNHEDIMETEMEKLDEIRRNGKVMGEDDDEVIDRLVHKIPSVIVY